MKRVVTISILIFIFVHSQNIQALHQGGSDLPYSQPMTHPLDKPLNDMYNGKCFFFNLGPTGIRARIDSNSPKVFKVMYVFQDSKSPAKGKVKIGDLIVGANGKLFKDPMGFHRKKGGRGWPGPPFELAKALEDSQGKDGILKLTVWPGGNKSSKKEVEIQLKPVGRFSKTFPWNCPRSDKLRKDLCDFMFETGTVNSKTQWRNIQHLLALLAAGDKRVVPLVTTAAKGLKNATANVMSGGFATWRWGYNGILLGEYFHFSKDKSILPGVKGLNYGYEVGQDWSSGGYSHKPFPHIRHRIATNGPKGYGSMAAPGGLAMLAQSLFKANGLPYSEMAYDRTHQAFLQTAGSNNDGSFAYGFKGYESVSIHLKDGAKSPCKSEKGIGFICPTGMKDIGDFEVQHWTKKGSAWNMELISDKKKIKSLWPWLYTEADKLKVYDEGHIVGNYNKQGTHKRMVIRPKELKEPTKPYKTGPGGCGHPSAVGMGAVAHYIGNEQNQPWINLGQHMATCSANSAKFTWDNHACAEMGAFFAVLGASRANAEDLRKFLDYSKTWIILSETHDGGLVEQPFGCQRNATGSLSRDRKTFTSVAILMLSLHLKKILLTGAGSGVVATTASSSATKASKKAIPKRQRMKFTAKQQDKLEKIMLATLLKLNNANLLKPISLKISKTKKSVWLAKVDSQAVLTFQLMKGKQQVGFKYEDLASSDKITLSRLIAALKPESKTAQALAGLYLEAGENNRMADKYFRKSSAESIKKIESMLKAAL